MMCNIPEERIYRVMSTLMRYWKFTTPLIKQLSNSIPTQITQSCVFTVLL